MRKIFLIALLCLAITQLQAQNSVVCKIKYLPNHTYQTATNLTMKILVNMNGNKEMIDKLSSQGITMPLNLDVKLALDGNLKSGSVGADNSFPLNMTYKINQLSIQANGKDIPMPANIEGKSFRIAAHSTQDGVLKVDSVDGKTARDSALKNNEQMMNMLRNAVKFPDRPLKAGDTFTIGSPITIPVKGNNAKLDFKVIYKLVSIADGKANFDIIQNLNMSFQMKKVNVSLSGTGNGKMAYSIKDNMPLNTGSDFNMKIKVVVDTLNVDGTATMNVGTTSVIN